MKSRRELQDYNYLWTKKQNFVAQPKNYLFLSAICLMRFNKLNSYIALTYFFDLKVWNLIGGKNNTNFLY